MDKGITPQELDSLARKCFSFMVQKDIDLIAQSLNEDLAYPGSVVYPAREEERLTGALIAIDLSNSSQEERDNYVDDDLYWGQRPKKSRGLARQYFDATGIKCKINYFVKDFTSPSFSSDKNALYIPLIAVHPEFQHRGIARGLMDRFIQDYLKRELYVNCNNNSEKLFRDRGFIPVIRRSAPNYSGIPHTFMGRPKAN